MKLVALCVAGLSIVVVSVYMWRPTVSSESLTPAEQVPPPLAPTRSPAVAADAPDEPAPRRDGTWNVTMQAQLPGVSRQPPPITFTQCVTREDAADPAKLVPLAGRNEAFAQRPEEVTCKILDQHLDGAKITWTAQCGDGPRPMTGVGEFIYGTETYVGTMNVTASRNDEPFTMTMNYSAQRLGDCVK